MSQSTNLVALVKPTYFPEYTEKYANETTDNHFSTPQFIYDMNDVFTEFENLTNNLTQSQIRHIIYESPQEAPNAVFPNNWITVHWETDVPMVVIYPMKANNRRKERNSKIVPDLLHNNLVPLKLIDLTYFEKDGQFLEGTGSLVLDRINKIAYCCLSKRTHQAVLNVWSKILGYETCIFRAYDNQKRPIYHTNVMMNIGDEFAIVCLAAIKNKKEKQMVYDYLTHKSQKKVILINMKQLHLFCGNCLQVNNIHGQGVLCLSKIAYNSLSRHQIDQIEQCCRGGISITDYSTIEKTAGGSVRCSLLEFFPTS